MNSKKFVSGRVFKVAANAVTFAFLFFYAGVEHGQWDKLIFVMPILATGLCIAAWLMRGGEVALVSAHTSYGLFLTFFATIVVFMGLFLPAWFVYLTGAVLSALVFYTVANVVPEISGFITLWGVAVLTVLELSASAVYAYVYDADLPIDASLSFIGGLF